MCFSSWLFLAACGDDSAGTPSVATLPDVGVIGGAQPAALAQVQGEADAAMCANGGVVVAFGLDSNANGTLESDEIQRSEAICNGNDGTPGRDGSDGAPGRDGTDGRNASDGPLNLVDFRDEPAGANCELGGIAIIRGVDANQNGRLDESEIAETAYVCSGDGVSVVQPAQAGDFCETADGKGYCFGNDAEPDYCTIRGGQVSAGGCGENAQCCVNVPCNDGTPGQCLGGGATTCDTQVMSMICPGNEQVLCCPEEERGLQDAFCATSVGNGFCFDASSGGTYCAERGGVAVNEGCEGQAGYECCTDVQCGNDVEGVCLGGSAMECANQPVIGICAGGASVLCCPDQPQIP